MLTPSSATDPHGNPEPIASAGMAIVDSAAVEALTDINAENWAMWAQEEEPALYRAQVHGSRTEDLQAAARQLATGVHPDSPEVARVHDDVARAKEVAQALRECDEQLRELRAAMPSGVRGATLQRGERARMRLEVAQIEGRGSVWEQEATRNCDGDIGMALLGAHRRSDRRRDYAYSSAEPGHGFAEVRRLLQAGFPALPGARPVSGASPAARGPVAGREPSASCGPER